MICFSLFNFKWSYGLILAFDDSILLSLMSLINFQQKKNPSLWWFSFFLFLYHTNNNRRSSASIALFSAKEIMCLNGANPHFERSASRLNRSLCFKNDTKLRTGIRSSIYLNLIVRIKCRTLSMHRRKYCDFFFVFAKRSKGLNYKCY